MKYKVVLSLVALLLFSCKPQVKNQDSLLAYVLPNAALIVKISQLSNFKSELKNNTFLNKTKGLPLHKALTHSLKGLEQVSANTPCLLALYEVGREDYQFVLIAKDHRNFLKKDSITDATATPFAYQDKNLVKYTFKDDVFYTMRHGEEIVLSSSLILIENMVRAKKNNPIAAPLRKLYETNSPGKSATLFVNLSEPSSLLSLSQTAKEEPYRPFSEWVSLDFSANSDRVSLNGVAMTTDSVKTFINLFKGTTPLASKTPFYTPLNAQAILSYTFDDYAVFAQNQNAYLDRVKPANPLFNTIEEVGVIYSNAQKVVLLHSYGAESLSDYLQTNKISTLSYRGKEMMQLQDKTLVAEGFEPLVQDFESNFCVILENTFVFAEDKAALQPLITTYGSTALFPHTPVYQTAKKNLANESSILFMADSAGIAFFAERNLPEYFTAIGQTDLSEHAFAFQLVSDKGFAHLTLAASTIEQTRANNSVAPLFTLALEADLVFAPQFVKNHETNQEEIIVQDENNVLYLISTGGKILWRKPLESRIQGPVHQVDIYKNGRLQLAFCTHNQFLILDRNGKEVLPFNKTFKGGNLNPLAVFDYDGRKDYRFVITQGKKVFMYNPKGNIVTGFTYTEAESPIIAAPKHFRVDNRDYLVFQLADHTLKILHRTGKERIKVPEKINFSGNEVLLYKNKFSVTNTKGVLHQIDTQGKLIATPFDLYKDHGMDATRNTLVFMNDHVLSINGKKVKLALGVYTRPKIFYRNNKIYVSVTDIQNQKIYLFDSQAKPFPNFPVFGNSVIDFTDMNNDKQLEFVAKDQENSLIVYQIHE